MKKLFIVTVLILSFVVFKLKSNAGIYPVKPTTLKPVVWISVSDSLPPLNTLVRTHVDINGIISNQQKAIRKEDGWYYPSGLTLLSWVPTHWESM